MITGGAKSERETLRKRASHPPCITVIAPMIGNWQLIRTIGEGEFGKVKLGVSRTTNKEVAVKLCKKTQIAATPNGYTKLMREIATLRLVRQHPYIVSLIDVVETDTYIAIVMDVAKGGELFEYILTERALSEGQSRKMFAQLMSAVSFIHSLGIVHRDLKLENILLDEEQNVLVSDFGFANQSAANPDGLLRTSCGSPCYAAPELVTSEHGYDGELADIWSCGVILFSMIAGYLPFDDDPANPDGDNIHLLYNYIMTTKLEYPDHVPMECRDLIDRILVSDPDKRARLDDIIHHPWMAPVNYVFEEEWERRKQMAAAVEATKELLTVQHSPAKSVKSTASGAEQRRVVPADPRLQVAKWASKSSASPIPPTTEDVVFNPLKQAIATDVIGADVNPYCASSHAPALFHETKLPVRNPSAPVPSESPLVPDKLPLRAMSNVLVESSHQAPSSDLITPDHSRNCAHNSNAIYDPNLNHHRESTATSITMDHEGTASLSKTENTDGYVGRSTSYFSQGSSSTRVDSMVLDEVALNVPELKAVPSLHEKAEVESPKDDGASVQFFADKSLPSTPSVSSGSCSGKEAVGGTGTLLGEFLKTTRYSDDRPLPAIPLDGERRADWAGINAKKRVSIQEPIQVVSLDRGEKKATGTSSWRFSNVGIWFFRESTDQSQTPVDKRSSTISDSVLSMFRSRSRQGAVTPTTSPSSPTPTPSVIRPHMSLPSSPSAHSSPTPPSRTRSPPLQGGYIEQFYQKPPVPPTSTTPTPASRPFSSGILRPLSFLSTSSQSDKPNRPVHPVTSQGSNDPQDADALRSFLRNFQPTRAATPASSQALRSYSGTSGSSSSQLHRRAMSPPPDASFAARSATVLSLSNSLHHMRRGGSSGRTGSRNSWMRNARPPPRILRTHLGAADHRALSTREPDMLILDLEAFFVKSGFHVESTGEENGEYRLKIVKKGYVVPVVGSSAGFGSVDDSRSALRLLDEAGVLITREEVSKFVEIPGDFDGSRQAVELRGEVARAIGRAEKTKQEAKPLPRLVSEWSKKWAYVKEYGVRYNIGYDTKPHGKELPTLPLGWDESQSLVKFMDEVVFYVELQRMSNLPGVCVVDFKRIRGNIWAFKKFYNHVVGELFSQTVL